MSSPIMASLGNAGPRIKLEWRGQVYEANFIDQKMKAVIEEEVYRRALRPILDTATRVPGPVVQLLLKELSNDYSTGQYSMFSNRGREFLQSPDGNTLLVGLVLGIDDTMDVLAIMAERSVEVQDVLSRVISLSFPALKTEETPENPR